MGWWLRSCPGSPDSPTLNAAVAVDPDRAPEYLTELEQRYKDAKVRRWGLWMDGRAALPAQALAQAGMVVTTASPGMGARLDEMAYEPRRASEGGPRDRRAGQ